MSTLHPHGCFLGSFVPRASRASSLQDLMLFATGLLHYPPAGLEGFVIFPQKLKGQARENKGAFLKAVQNGGSCYECRAVPWVGDPLSSGALPGLASCCFLLFRILMVCDEHLVFRLWASSLAAFLCLFVWVMSTPSTPPLPVSEKVKEK